MCYFEKGREEMKKQTFLPYTLLFAMFLGGSMLNVYGTEASSSLFSGLNEAKMLNSQSQRECKILDVFNDFTEHLMRITDQDKKEQEENALFAEVIPWMVEAIKNEKNCNLITAYFNMFSGWISYGYSNIQEKYSDMFAAVIERVKKTINFNDSNKDRELLVWGGFAKFLEKELPLQHRQGVQAAKDKLQEMYQALKYLAVQGADVSTLLKELEKLRAK